MPDARVPTSDWALANRAIVRAKTAVISVRLRKFVDMKYYF